jgi:hypothetical protein
MYLYNCTLDCETEAAAVTASSPAKPKTGPPCGSVHLSLVHRDAWVPLRLCANAG